MILQKRCDVLKTTSGVVVWMPQNVRQACIDEATRTFPLETGGTFMGWWADATTAVISVMIGPGPKASRGRHHFQPDQEWQLDQIAEHYDASDRRETFLGDWHSHPNASVGTLSSTDRQVLRRVIDTPSARCARPLMAICWGHPNQWQTALWHADVRRFRFMWEQLSVTEARLELYRCPEPDVVQCYDLHLSNGKR